MGQTSLYWNARLQETENLQVLKNLSTLLAPRGSQFARDVCAKAMRGEWDDLVGMEFPQYDSYTQSDVSKLITDRQVFALFQKNASIPTSVDKEEVAWREFQRAEAVCKETNAFFRALQRHPSFSPWPSPRESSGFDPVPSFIRTLLRARRDVRRVLGEAPPKVEDLQVRFGPGATSGIRKKEASWQAKLAQTPTCSRELEMSIYFDHLCRSMPHWLDCHGEPVTQLEEDGTWSFGYDIDVALSVSHLQFVPKNAKTHRAIVVQPTLNSMLQAAVGDWMTKRLRSVGVDIRDQTKNQRAAREGSLTGRLATLDLKSASDMIARELVKFLVGEEWYYFLSSISCFSVKYNTTQLTLEKMSSMGNGYTFPLETLIFWSVARAASQHPGDVLAYGDDLVCNVDDVEAVSTALIQCGFEISKTKSYWSGCFRESCGADYYNGIDIRPVYVKEHLTWTDLFRLHNWFYRQYDCEVSDFLCAQIPESLRIFGPDGYGDGHLLTRDPPYRRNREMRRCGYGGFKFDTYREIGMSHPNLYPGDYVTPLYAIYCVEDQPDDASLFEELKAVRSKMIRSVSWPERTQEKNHDRLGRVMWPLPGTTGVYELVSIYTLSW